MVRWALQSCTLGLLQHQLLPNLMIFATIVQTVIPVSGSRVVSSEIVPRTDRLADFGTSIWVHVRNYPIRQLGDRCCQTVQPCSCSCWFSRGDGVGSGCGNVCCCSMGAYTGGLGYPRVTHVRSVRHRLRQPIINSVSRSISLPTGVLYYSRFCRSRLWNRSVFMVYVPDGVNTWMRGGIILESSFS